METFDESVQSAAGAGPGLSASDQGALLFIVGRGRSGTTLLSRMLGAHPALAVAPEGFFVANLQRRYGRGRWSVGRVHRFCRDLVRERRMATWGLDGQDVARRLLGQFSHLDYRRACLAVYRSYGEHTLRKGGLRWVGDKNPHYALLLPRLLRLFPGARFLHVVRDPRDNVLSYQSVPFDVREPHALAYRWRAYNAAIVRAAEGAPERFHRVRYEDLLADPAATLTGVCRFLDLDYAPHMLSFHETEQNGFYGADSPWFQHLNRPLDGARAGQWQALMAQGQVEAVERICGPMMAQLGYMRSTEPRPGVSFRSAFGTAFGVAFGAAAVAAERLIFDVAPADIRIRLINLYRSRTGRV